MAEIMQKMDEQKVTFHDQIKKYEDDKLKIQQGDMILKLFNIMYYSLSKISNNIISSISIDLLHVQNIYNHLYFISNINQKYIYIIYFYINLVCF